MPLAHEVSENCPRCGHPKAWRHEKEEGSGTKLQYECVDCAFEWSEWRSKEV